MQLFHEMADERIDVKELSEQSRLVEDLGFTSFNLIWMVFNIQREFSIDINHMKDWKPVTIGDVCQLIERESNEK